MAGKGFWIKMRGSLHEDPAVAQMSELLDKDELDITGRLARIWSWASDFGGGLKNGYAKGIGAKYIDRMVRMEGFAQAMVTVGWLIIDDDGLKIPGWEKHHSDHAKKKADQAARQQKKRAKEAQSENLNHNEAKLENVTDVTTARDKCHMQNAQMSQARVTDVTTCSNQHQMTSDDKTSDDINDRHKASAVPNEPSKEDTFAESRDQSSPPPASFLNLLKSMKHFSEHAEEINAAIPLWSSRLKFRIEELHLRNAHNRACVLAKEGNPVYSPTRWLCRFIENKAKDKARQDVIDREERLAAEKKAREWKVDSGAPEAPKRKSRIPNKPQGKSMIDELEESKENEKKNLATSAKLEMAVA